MKELSDVKVSHWRTLGRNLGINKKTLSKLLHQVIDKDEQKMMVFRLWLQTSLHPTLQKLADALDNSVNAQDKLEAAKIRKKIEHSLLHVQ